MPHFDYSHRMHSTWQSIAEKLSESGWSWRHVTFLNRAASDVHVVEARDDEGHVHAVVAESVEPAFVALEESIKAAGK